MWVYRCKVLRVVDGDTVDVDIDLGFDVWLRKARVRLAGIDTAELHAKDAAERARAQAAQARVASLLPADGGFVELTVEKYGADEKFGRILGRLRTAAGFDVASTLLAEGHARAYDGGKR